jgi:hypothetical protein
LNAKTIKWITKYTPLVSAEDDDGVRAGGSISLQIEMIPPMEEADGSI